MSQSVLGAHLVHSSTEVLAPNTDCGMKLRRVSVIIRQWLEVEFWVVLQNGLKGEMRPTYCGVMHPPLFPQYTKSAD